MIQLTKISLMAEDPVWDPNSSEYADQEADTMKYRGEFITCEATARLQFSSTQLVHAMLQISQTTQI